MSDLVEQVARAIHDHLCRRDIMQYLTNNEDCEGIAQAVVPIILEAAAGAVRNCMVAQEWPPQDGDQQIDEVLAAIAALASPEGER